MAWRRTLMVGQAAGGHIRGVPREGVIGAHATIDWCACCAAALNSHTVRAIPCRALHQRNRITAHKLCTGHPRLLTMGALCPHSATPPPCYPPPLWRVASLLCGRALFLFNLFLFSAAAVAVQCCPFLFSLLKRRRFGAIATVRLIKPPRYALSRQRHSPARHGHGCIYNYELI